MQNAHLPLADMVRRIEKRSPLGAADREALLQLPCTVREAPAGAHLVRDGDRPEFCIVLLSGLAFRHKITGEGARQIISLHMPSEFVDLQHAFLDVADTSVQALTRVSMALVPRQALQELALQNPRVGKALWIDSLVDSSIFREWVVNVGRRDSRARVAHILCEFSLRLESMGLADRHRFTLPVTQEQLADAVGLTPVHVNRVLRALEEEGLISRDKRSMTIDNWEELCRLGDFSDRYLHREPVAA